VLRRLAQLLWGNSWVAPKRRAPPSCRLGRRSPTDPQARHLRGCRGANHRRELRQQISRTRPTHLGGLLHQAHTIAEHRATEDAVMASEIEQLPDLSGFLKVASRPEWRRVTIARPDG
jgi:hypothetical protein